MTTFNNYELVTLQNLVDNPNCSEEDVAQWVRNNNDKFEDESHPGEFSQDKVNKLFGDVIQNNAPGSSLENLGIDCSSVIDWFNDLTGPKQEKRSGQEWNLADMVLTWGKKLLGSPDAGEEKKAGNNPPAEFGMGPFDLGDLIKYSKNPKLKKVLWILDKIYKEVKKNWPSKRRTTRRTTTAKRATTSRSRTTSAKKTSTSRSTTAKKTASRSTTAKKTTAKKTVAKKTPTRSTTAKKTTTRSTTAKKTTAKKPSTKKIW